MANVRFEPDWYGIREFLRSDDTQRLVDGIAAGMMAGLPSGYAQEARKTNRSVATIHAESRAARADNLKNNTLLRLLG